MSTKRPFFSTKWLSLYWTLWGAALRTHSLFSNTFHSDEALFASWARAIAVWRDPWLRTAALDKPPLLFYLQALFYPMQGPVEWAARLPNFIASILLIPLVGQLAQAWGVKRPWLAVALVASSPLAIQFSGTAFTDPLLTFLLTLALWQASKAQPKRSGLFFGLALLTKYQAILFAPLLLICLIGPSEKSESARQKVGKFIATTSLLIVFLFLWEYGRSGQFLLWRNQVNNFGGLRLAWSWELWPRLWSWSQFWLLTSGSGWLALFFWPPQRKADHNIILSVVPIYLFGYFSFHWLVAIPVWDRYLLPITPLLAIAIASIFRNEAPSSQTTAPFRYTTLSSWLIIMLLITQGLFARTAVFPIGSSPTSDDGAAQIAHYLENEPYGTVLYDHWYSWQWGYHLFDDKVHTSWVPHPQQLQRELQAFGDTEVPRYLVLVTDERATPFITVVQESGFTLKSIVENDKIILYRLERNKNQ